MNAFPGQQPGERYVSKKAHNDGSPQPAAKIFTVIKIGAHTSHCPARRTVGKAGAGNCCIKATIASPGHLQRAIATLHQLTHRPRQSVAASQRCGSDRFRLSEANFSAGLEYLARPFVTLIFGLLGHPDDDCQRLHPTPAQSPISRLGHWAVGPDQIPNPRTKAGTGQLEEPFPGTAFLELFQKFDFYDNTSGTVTVVQIDAVRVPKELFYIPALLLLGLVTSLQRHRQTVPAF